MDNLNHNPKVAMSYDGTTIHAPIGDGCRPDTEDIIAHFYKRKSGVDDSRADSFWFQMKNQNLPLTLYNRNVVNCRPLKGGQKQLMLPLS